MTSTPTRPAPAKIKPPAPPKPDTLAASRVRDALLHRLESHLNRDDVRNHLIRKLDIRADMYIDVVQFTVEVLFPECDDIDRDDYESGLKPRQGLIPRGRVERLSLQHLRDLFVQMAKQR